MRSALSFTLTAICATTLLASPAPAQTYHFGEIAWGSTRPQARAALRALGYRPEADTTREGDVGFTGDILGYPIVGVAFFASGKLEAVIATHTVDVQRADETFADLRAALVEKLGTPKLDQTASADPDDLAQRAGVGYLFRTSRRLVSWSGNLPSIPGDKVILGLTGGVPPTISIVYASRRWPAEAEHRVKANRRRFDN